MDMGIFIKNRRNALGLTQKDVADFVGVSEGTVSRWESSNISNMRRDRIAKLADILHVSPTLIMGVDDNTKDDESAPTYIKHIPVLGNVVAGQPIEAIEDIIDWEDIDTRQSQFRYGDFFGLRINGSSMQPTLQDGDIVIVRKQSYIRNGEIGIVMVNGNEATVKEVREERNGITLVAHNAAVFKPTFCSREQIESEPVRVLGVVVELRRKFMWS